MKPSAPTNWMIVMMYRCKKAHPKLTVGTEYREVMPIPNAYNACIKCDDGEYEYIPRKEFFDVVENNPLD